MVYRHYDVKKYVNIKIEKGLILKTIFIFTFAIILYYQTNIYIRLFNLIVVCIYAVLINKDFLLSTYKTVTSKFKKNK